MARGPNASLGSSPAFDAPIDDVHDRMEFFLPNYLLRSR